MKIELPIILYLLLFVNFNIPNAREQVKDQIIKNKNYYMNLIHKKLIIDPPNLTPQFSFSMTPNLLQPLSNSKLYSGFFHSCAIISISNNLKCWGNNLTDQLDFPDAVQYNTQSLALGESHSCAIASDTLPICWGGNEQGQNDIPILSRKQSRSIAAGPGHSCLVSASGKITCWGDDRKGQSAVPFSAIQDGDVVKAGGSHTIVCDNHGELQCWGDNSQGQCTTPQRKFDWGTKSVALGISHSCGVSSQGWTFCWGQQSDEASNGIRAIRIPEKLKSEGERVSTLGNHSCVVRTGGMLGCWGVDQHEQASVPDGWDSFVESVAVGYAHTCILETEGAIRCWGDNFQDQCQAPAKDHIDTH